MSNDTKTRRLFGDALLSSILGFVVLAVISGILSIVAFFFFDPGNARAALGGACLALCFVCCIILAGLYRYWRKKNPNVSSEVFLSELLHGDDVDDLSLDIGSAATFTDTTRNLRKNEILDRVLTEILEAPKIQLPVRIDDSNNPTRQSNIALPHGTVGEQHVHRSVSDQKISHIGINGTGVTAIVTFASVRSLGDGPPPMLTITNTSESGFITNVGFMIEPAHVGKVRVSTSKDHGDGHGVYEMTDKPDEIETEDFIATCPFGLRTVQYINQVAESFREGYIHSGIPPGTSTTLLFGGSFKDDPTPAQISRGVVLRFEQIGEEALRDIAMYKNLDALFPTKTEPSIYQIKRKKA